VPALALAAAAAAPAAGHQQVEAPHDGFREAEVVEDGHAEESEDAQTEEHAGHQQPHSAHDAHGGGQHDPRASHGTHSGAHAAAHSHGGHEGHHGGHHHVVPSVMGTTTAVMLLGFVAFIMALFYLVNWHDPDIRQYTWVISSVTVSIFLGVLSFQGVAQAIDFFFPDNITTEIMQFLLLWVATQTILFVVRDVDNADSSGAEKHGYGQMEQPEGHGQNLSHASRDEEAHTEPLKEGHPAARSPVDSDEEGGRQPSAPLKGHLAAHSPADSDEEGGRLPNVPLKAYGMILAHITGFAGIKCFGSMQLHFQCFSSSWQCTMLVIPIFCAVVYTLIMVSQWVRKKLIMNFGDQVEDESEELWREQCSETEDDIIGLVLSSLVSVVIRYAITGTLPSAHGTTEGRQALEVISLFGTGVGCLALVILVTFQRNSLLKKHEDNPVHNHQFFSKEHFVNTLQIFLGLTMSWCFYFGTQWGFYVFLKHKQSMKGVTGKLLEALLVSFGSMLAIFALDSVGDGSPSMKKALKGLITALGLLVGISWEGAFALGVDEVAANWNTPHAVLVAKTLLALGLVVVVMPAWRLYIMPKSDPAIMRYYKGKLPPLMALCMKWDPATDHHLSKTERFRQKAKANGLLKGLDTVRAAARLSLTPRSSVKPVPG